MAYYYTETQIRAERIQDNLDRIARIDPSLVDYCKREARKLYELGIPAEDGHTCRYDECLDSVAEMTRIEQENARARRSAELGDE